MALPTSTNEVTARKLSSVISGLWNKIKNLLAGKSDITEGVYYVVGTHDYPAWAANHAYAVNDTVNYGNQIKVCKTAHTSGSSYDSSKWNNLGTPVLKGTIDGVTALYTGLKIAYRWPCYGGSSSTYLNINGLGNVYVRRNNGNLTTHLPIGSVSFLAYDGTYWQWADYDSNTNNWVTTMGAYCDTAAATAAKVATSTNTVLTAGMSFLIRIVNANTSASKLTLNINSQGAKDVWINGAISSASNYTIPAGEHWCHYDGSVFHIWTDGTAQFKQLKLTNKLSDANIASAATWNAKQNALTAQTAYSAKGTATKVPQITTNSLGQVTGITEVTISGVTPASHTHGNITNAGAIGTASGNAVYTTTNGVLTAGSLATTDPSVSGNSLTFIDTISQDSKGKITATKKSVTVDSAMSSSSTNPVQNKVVDSALSNKAPLASPALTGTPTAPTAAAGTNTTQIATTAFVKQAVTDGLATADAMIYKGTIAGGSTGNYGALTAAASKGWTYKVTTAGKIDGIPVEVGDILICNTDNTAAATSSNYSTIAANWDFVQTNIDGAVTGPSSVTSGQVAAFDGTTGKVIKALDAAGVRTAAGLGTASTKDVPSSGNASNTQVVLGNDTRLTDSRTPTSHAHGNIQNGGTLQTTDVTIANGDKLVVTDSSDSNKVARTSVLFDGSTTTKALTQKGTFESFAKSGDITTAIQALDVSSVGGAGKYISAISETDGKISATAITMDTTPTASSTNAVTSGGVKTALDGKADSSHTHGNITNGGALQTTDVTIANGDKLVVTDASNSNKVARTSLAFDGSTTGQLLSKAGSFQYPKEAYLEWGGKNFTGSYGPIDAAMISELGANRFAFGKAAGIVVEYTRDGGTTWVDYGLTDAQKSAIFSTGQSIKIGKSDSTNNAIKVGTNNYKNYKVRVTITTNTFGVYSQLNKFVIYCSTSGSQCSKVTLSGRTRANVSAGTDTWSNFGTMTLGGWSGYNVLNTGYITTYGNQNSHFQQLRFLFEDTVAPTNADNEQYQGLSVSRILGFGGVGWQTPSTMASNGHLYAYDYAKNATFPANVTATSFTGSLTGNADTATKATQDSDGNAINATYFKSSGNVTLVSGTATKIGTQNGADVKLTLPTIPAAVSVKGNAESSYRTGQVNLTPENLGISATTSSVTVGSTTFNKYTHPTTSGNKHVPSGGSSGQFLGWDSDGTAKWVANPNTDTKVKATAKTDNVNYKILATASASPTSGNATEAVYDADITLNPSTNTIAANVSGTATTAAGYTSNGAIATALGGKVDKVSGKGLSTNDYTTTEKNKLAGIASGAEVNVQSDWDQTTTTADDYIKNKPTIPSGTQLVYDCGTGSTSGTDFDNALAAFNAGRWVIIHQYTNVYYCVGTYNSGLRFKRLTNDTTVLKVDTLNWTRGSAPVDGTALEAALVGHSHSNYVPTSRKINGKTLDTDITLSASDVGAVTASKSAYQGSNETSLVTRGEKYTWNNKQDLLPSTWDPASGPTYGIALDEGGIDRSLKNISNSPSGMTSDTYILVHDAVGETSYWRSRHINKLWDWVKGKIGSVLNLYTRDNNTPYFDGLAANAVQAISTTNANITRTADTTNGDKLQIGTGTAVNITNAGRANYADNAGYATSAGTASSASTATKAEQDANGATLAPLVINYNSGSFPDVFNQLTTAYVSKRRIYCLYSLAVAGSTDRAEIKIPLSSVRFSSSGSVKSFEFVTPFISRGSSSSDIAGQITIITVNHLDNGSYNWGIEFQWPYAANQAGYANTAGTANDYNTSTGTIKSALDGKASTSHTHGISSLSIGKVTVDGNFFVPRLPCYYAQGNINIVDGSIDIAAAAAANGFGTPLIVYNSTSSTITVKRSSSASSSIEAYKHKIFVRSAGDAIAFYDMMT